jgi:hypothetical protein
MDSGNTGNSKGRDISSSIDRFFGSTPPPPQAPKADDGVSGFTAPKGSNIGKMFGMSDPETREKLIAEQQALIDKSAADKALVEDSHNDSLVRESFQEIQSNPASRASLAATTERMAGAQPGELKAPGEDGMSAVDKMNQLTRFLAMKAQAQKEGLTPQLQRDLQSLDSELAWLSKDRKDMTRQESLGIGLIAVLPALIGMMAGGKKGLVKGIAAGLSAAGGELVNRGGMSDEQRMKTIIELQKVKSQKQGLLLSAEEAKAKTSKINPEEILRLEVASRLNVKADKVDGLDDKQLRAVDTFGAGVQSMGFEVENPRVSAGLSDPERKTSRDMLSSLQNMKATLSKMKELVDAEGGGFGVGGILSGEWIESPHAAILNQLHAEGLNQMRFFTNSGANMTFMEVVLNESMIPDVTGLLSGWNGTFAIDRLNNALALMDKQEGEMLRKLGLKRGMTAEERQRLEELEMKANQEEGKDNGKTNG